MLQAFFDRVVADSAEILAHPKRKARGWRSKERLAFIELIMSSPVVDGRRMVNLCRNASRRRSKIFWELQDWDRSERERERSAAKVSA